MEDEKREIRNIASALTAPDEEKRTVEGYAILFNTKSDGLGCEDLFWYNTCRCQDGHIALTWIDFLRVNLGIWLRRGCGRGPTRATLRVGDPICRASASPS